MRRKLVWRCALGLVALVLAAGLAAPYFNVSRYGKNIQQSLEAALGRKVEIGEAHLDLFHGPGVSVEGVVIHEDPSSGLEPLVYLTSGTLEARVSLRSLWTGRLEFSSLQLNDPSINLSKVPSGPWNVEPVLTRTVGAAKAQRPGVRIPEIQIRGGRINFKSGDRKSVYYLTDSEVNILPPDSPGGVWRFNFRVEPARADRPAHGFGEITGRGQWRPDPATGGSLDLFLNAERSRIAELAALIHGRDLGVHGFVTANARLRGPISDLAIEGNLQVADIHRWDLLPARGEAWPLKLRGRLDLSSRRLELDTAGDTQAPLPFAVAFRAADYLSQPRWAVVVYLNRLPVRAFPDLTRQFGVAVPAGFAAEGEMEGAVGYSPDSGFQGTVITRNASLRIPDAPPVTVVRAALVIDRDRVHFGPAELETARKQKADFEADYDREAAEFSTSLTTDELDIAELQTGFGRLIGTAGAPLLKDCSAGRWEGNLSWSQHGAEPGAWTGTGRVSGAEFPLPGLAGAVALKTALVSVRDDALDVTRMSGTAGDIGFQGDYRFRSKAARPHQFRISAASVDGAELEDLLGPALERREGLLARALRLGRQQAAPAWLRDRRAEGTVEFGSLSLGPVQMEQVRAKVRWDGLTAELADLAGRLPGGALAGRAAVSLRRAAPSYRANIKFTDFAWRSGKWDAESVIQTSGIGSELLRNLRSTGTFHCRAATLLADTEFRSIAGAFTFSGARRPPVLTFTELQAVVGSDSLKGTGSTRADGRLEFDLTDGQRQVLMTGTLSPFQLEMSRGAVQPAALPK